MLVAKAESKLLSKFEIIPVNFRAKIDVSI